MCYLYRLYFFFVFIFALFGNDLLLFFFNFSSGRLCIFGVVEELVLVLSSLERRLITAKCYFYSILILSIMILYLVFGACFVFVFVYLFFWSFWCVLGCYSEHVNLLPMMLFQHAYFSFYSWSVFCFLYYLCLCLCVYVFFDLMCIC